MVTKVINTGDSSTGLYAVIIVVLLLGAGFFAYSQGFFDNSKDININLPGGKSISGTIKE